MPPPSFLVPVRRLLAAGVRTLVVAGSALLPGQAGGLDALIQQKMTEVGIMGFAAAVIVDQQVVWMKGFGHRDWQQRHAFTPRTIMNVASIAKPVVGVAMMRAVAEGKLSLDADINRYLPFRVQNPHQPQQVVALRHLATHTSSIADRWEVYRRSYRFGEDPTETLGEFLAGYLTPTGKYYSRENFLDARPGELREYSNIGAALAGFIVERALGEPLDDYTRRAVFAPLGMTRTGWFMREVDMANHSTLFVSQGGHTVPILHYGLTTYPEGGLRTSVEDLSKFFIAMLGDGQYQGVRILDAASAAEMQRFQFTDGNHPKNFPPADGNSGIFWRTKFSGRRRGHGGSDPGVEVEMLTDASRRIGVIYFANTSVGDGERRATGEILEALWAHGESVKTGR